MSVKAPRYVLQKASEPSSFVRRHWLFVSLMVLAVLTYLLGRYTNFDVLQAFKGQQKTLVTENQTLKAENEDLKFQVSQWKTEAQVKTQAIQELQTMIAQQENQLSELKSEVVFFESLLINPSQNPGLSVFKAEAKPVNGHTQIQLILSQKMTKAQEKSGNIDLLLKGIKGASGETLDLTEQFGLVDQFKLKYFQIMNFGINIPEGFQPTELVVTLKVKGNKPPVIKSQFAWSDIYKS